ncbi:MAG: hypothetical protein ACXVCJ_13825 [Polyangiales bacterium]
MLRVGLALTIVASGCSRHTEITADEDRHEWRAPKPPPDPARGLRFVTRAKVGKPAIVEGCEGPSPCAEWVRYPPSPPRTFVDVRASRTSKHFFVWTKPDGKKRTLEIFATPGTSSAATRVAHLEPGFGGDLTWLEGDLLLHVWGCGTNCASVRVYHTTGGKLFEEGGVELVEADDRRVVTANGAFVTLYDVVGRTRFVHEAKPAPPSMPNDVHFDAKDFAIRFDGATLRCTPGVAPTLGCTWAPP